MDIPLLIAAFLAMAAAVGLAGLRRVPEGSVYTLHRFGRFIRALGPGLHATVPVFDQIAHEVPLVGHHVDLPTPAALSRAEVFFQILDPQQAGQALDEVDDMVQALAQERLAQLAAADGNAEPRALALRLKDELNGRLRRLGLHVTRCQLA